MFQQKNQPFCTKPPRFVHYIGSLAFEWSPHFALHLYSKWPNILKQIRLESMQFLFTKFLRPLKSSYNNNAKNRQ